MISAILACGRDGVIGKDNGLPWGRIKEDMQYFKQKTIWSTVIMGGNTYKSLGMKPLPMRHNIVIHNPSYGTLENSDFITVADDVERLIECVYDVAEVFVIGGAKTYEAFLPQTDRIYLTYIDEQFEGDTFFNMDVLDDFKLVDCRMTISEKDKYPLYFCVYDRV